MVPRRKGAELSDRGKINTWKMRWSKPSSSANLSSVVNATDLQSDFQPPTPGPNFTFDFAVKIEGKSPIMDDYYNDPQADFILISSDNIAFKVHKYHLLSESPVFRDMCSMVGSSFASPTLNLTDTTFETARVIRLFLDFLQKRSPPDPSRETVVTTRLLIQFVDKYDCQLVSHAMKAYARRFFDLGTVGPDDLFILGSNFDDVEYCAEAIRRSGFIVFSSGGTIEGLGSGWSTKEENSHGHIGRPTEDASVLDVRAWRVEEIAKVPPKYLAALMRASIDFEFSVPFEELEVDEWDNMAKEFTELMNYEKESKK
ncbi:hypothetical protein CI109_101274 [Kwoniella shandongensis]|uniref:Uncharacterized protein n=1 Tax=Kwoniella shandongensis TaxID=1734106 RepID=A0A5M6BQR6_9TREE|nr:uncharacterized protein CI109_007224 [Kwoniella shandongensis]KAA5524432.1 hypothetical protein CI109_007224 [Kwoniella shandongensis]